MDDAPLAELVYSIDDKGNLIIEHTEVDKSLEGKNVGTELVYKAVEYARERNLQVIPKCSFAKSVLENRKG